MNFLKQSVLALALTVSTAYAQVNEPGFAGGSDIGSAFVNGDTLYVTVLGDCNPVFGNLVVEPRCSADRLTKDFQFDCAADLHLVSSLRGCLNGEKIPHVVKISLFESRMTREARVLNMNFRDRVIQVKLK